MYVCVCIIRFIIKYPLHMCRPFGLYPPSLCLGGDNQLGLVL